MSLPVLTIRVLQAETEKLFTLTDHLTLIAPTWKIKNDDTADAGKYRPVSLAAMTFELLNTSIYPAFHPLQDQTVIWFHG